MFQVRIHGRGGQGVVTAAELLSIAAFLEGRHAQAWPSFGAERMGAPVVAYCRIDDTEIRNREPIVRPDAVIVQDATLLLQTNVVNGLRPDGYVLANSTGELHDLEFEGRRDRIVRVPATDIALRHLGRPIPNAALLGGFAALTGVVSLSAVLAAIRERFASGLANRNAAAASETYTFVSSALKESSHA